MKIKEEEEEEEEEEEGIPDVNSRGMVIIIVRGIKEDKDRFHQNINSDSKKKKDGKRRN